MRRSPTASSRATASCSTAAAWRSARAGPARDHGRAASSLVADLGFALRTRGGADGMPDLLRSLLTPGQFDADLDAALAGSEPLRQRFGRVALTGLMLLRNPLGRRRRVG